MIIHQPESAKLQTEHNSWSEEKGFPFSWEDFGQLAHSPWYTGLYSILGLFSYLIPFCLPFGLPLFIILFMKKFIRSYHLREDVLGLGVTKIYET